MYPEQTTVTKINKGLATANGIIGLTGGIILLFSILIVALATTTDSDAVIALVFIFTYAVRLAILVLGIVGAATFKGPQSPVNSAASVLLIIGGAISFIPFFGWIGGILAIIGGSLYLASLKNFTHMPVSAQTPQNPFIR